MKRVKLIRQCTLKLEDGELEHSKTGEVPQELYDNHSGWFEEVPDFEAMTVEELQEELRERELKVSGTKAELVERLTGA